MNAAEFTWITTVSAATEVVPSPATTTSRKKANAANSRNQFTPTGSPKRRSRRSSAARRGPVPGRRPSRTNGARRPTKAAQVESAFASAAPRGPSAGAPSRPSMSTQLPATVRTIAATLATMGRRVFPSPP
jgi:hypothetical protein